MPQVCAYIDGYNLYYGLRQRKWTQYYWFDPYQLIEKLLVDGQELVSVKYFTARVRGPADKKNRQSAYLSALDAVSQAEVIHGKFYRKPQSCKNCQSTWFSHEEKMTDSAIASHLVADAFREQFDTALLIGGDTDIVPAIKIVRRWFPKKRLVVWFPPARRNQAVEDACHDLGNINGEHLRLSQMPDSIDLNEGVTIHRPQEWV